MNNIHYHVYFVFEHCLWTPLLLSRVIGTMTRSWGLFKLSALIFQHCILIAHKQDYWYYLQSPNEHVSHALISKVPIIIIITRALFLHLHYLAMHWMLVWLHLALGNWEIFITIIFFPHWEKTNQWRVTVLQRKMIHLILKQTTQYLQEGYSTMWLCHIISLS